MDKLSLTRLKKHQIAKTVGLIEKGDWRYAINKLIDTKGKPLKGKYLEKAKLLLGIPSKRHLKIIDKFQNKNKGKEIGALILGKKIEKLKGTEHAVTLASPKLKNPRISLHTHPNSIPDQSVMYEAVKDIAPENYKWLKNRHIKRYMQVSPSGSFLQKEDGSMIFRNHTFNDVGQFVKAPQHQLNTILSKKYIGVHKYRPKLRLNKKDFGNIDQGQFPGIRSIYFKR